MPMTRAQSANAFKDTLNDVPAEIGSLYDKAVDRLASGGQLFTRRDLSLEGPRYAAELTLGDRILDLPQFLRTECGSFLSIVPSGTGGSVDHRQTLLSAAARFHCLVLRWPRSRAPCEREGRTETAVSCDDRCKHPKLILTPDGDQMRFPVAELGRSKR
jgi:hypothetical protein